MCNITQNSYTFQSDKKLYILRYWILESKGNGCHPLQRCGYRNM